MHKEQLVKAFELMKAGEKGQASMIVKGILREDPKNLNAWWLMSHIFDDDDKVVKSLEKVLQIDPAHQAARRRLAQLRPEYGNLVSDDVTAAKQSKKDSAKADANYWKKLDNPPLQSKPKSSMWGMLGNRFVLRLVFIVIFGAIAGIGALWNNFQSSQTIHDASGNTPSEAIETFLRASIIGDVETLRAITCPEISGYVDSIINDFNDDWDYDITVDFTDTVFELEHHDYRNDRAYITLSGTATISSSGYSTDVDWREAARADGYSFFGEFAAIRNGRWVVCEEYNVPNVDHDSEY